MAWHFSNVLEKQFTRAALESWRYSREPEAAYWVACFWAGVLYAPSSLIVSAPDDLCSGKMKATCHRSPYGTMYVPLGDASGEALLTWFREDFLVRTLAEQEPTPAVLDWTEKSRVCGKSFLELLRNARLQYCLLKIPPGSAIMGLIEYSGSLPVSGTMRNGLVWERTRLEPAIVVTVALFWHGTPRCRSGLGASQIWSPKWQFDSKWEWFLHKRFSRGAFRTYPNPECGESVMGWPLGWTATLPLATAKFRSWQRAHLENFYGEYKKTVKRKLVN